MLKIAAAGLKRRRRLNSKGLDESYFLELLVSRVETGKCPADYLLEDYYGKWGEQIDPIFVDCAY